MAKWLLARLTAAGGLVYFSIAELGSTGSWWNAAIAAVVLYGFWWLGTKSVAPCKPD